VVRDCALLTHRHFSFFFAILFFPPARWRFHFFPPSKVEDYLFSETCDFLKRMFLFLKFFSLRPPLLPHLEERHFKPATLISSFARSSFLSLRFKADPALDRRPPPYRVYRQACVFLFLRLNCYEVLVIVAFLSPSRKLIGVVDAAFLELLARSTGPPHLFINSFFLSPVAE